MSNKSARAISRDFQKIVISNDEERVVFSNSASSLCFTGSHKAERARFNRRDGACAIKVAPISRIYFNKCFLS